MGRAHRPERSSQRASARSPEGPEGLVPFIRDVALAGAKLARCSRSKYIQYMHMCICEPRLVSITDSEHLGAWSVFLSAPAYLFKTLDCCCQVYF